MAPVGGLPRAVLRRRPCGPLRRLLCLAGLDCCSHYGVWSSQVVASFVDGSNVWLVVLEYDVRCRAVRSSAGEVPCSTGNWRIRYDTAKSSVLFVLALSIFGTVGLGPWVVILPYDAECYGYFASWEPGSLLIKSRTSPAIPSHSRGYFAAFPGGPVTNPPIPALGTVSPVKPPMSVSYPPLGSSSVDGGSTSGVASEAELVDIMESDGCNRARFAHLLYISGDKQTPVSSAPRTAVMGILTHIICADVYALNLGMRRIGGSKRKVPLLHSHLDLYNGRCKRIMGRRESWLGKGISWTANDSKYWNAFVALRSVFSPPSMKAIGRLLLLNFATSLKRRCRNPTSRGAKAAQYWIWNRASVKTITTQTAKGPIIKLRTGRRRKRTTHRNHAPRRVA